MSDFLSGEHVNKWLTKADKAFFARDAVRKFNEGEIEDKRYVLSRLVSNLKLKDKKLSITLDEILEALKNAAKEVNEIHERLELVEGTDRTSQLKSLYEQNPRVLADIDAIRTFWMQNTEAFYIPNYN